MRSPPEQRAQDVAALSACRRAGAYSMSRLLRAFSIAERSLMLPTRQDRRGARLHERGRQMKPERSEPAKSPSRLRAKPSHKGMRWY